ncbi:MAG TPA: YbaK/EbsC family protein [Vicinamibacteria bacterium]|nr:YbaK/EbsC family protein [Vicinamibacteria bacterium]
MAISARLQSLLDAEHASYSTRRHAQAFTAQEVAAQSHVPGRDLAKVVIARTPEGAYLMAVLPSLCRVDLVALAKAARAESLALAHEDEIRRLFPDCEPGAMPPFGRLYGLPVFVDACFPHYETLYFQAGNHREVVGMPYHEFERLASPTMGEFCLHVRKDA